MPHIYELNPGGPQNHLATVTIVGSNSCRDSRSTCGINISGDLDLDDRIDECPPCTNDINLSGLSIGSMLTSVSGTDLFVEDSC